MAEQSTQPQPNDLRETFHEALTDFSRFAQKRQTAKAQAALHRLFTTLIDVDRDGDVVGSRITGGSKNASSRMNQKGFRDAGTAARSARCRAARR